ncbi:NAD(P)/FAD-dependent oxidoreductase [Aeromicrobium ponti]|uniref:Cation diffusion facilitator CzcD-associated flavoprotein CzcO n=1 Tax=Cytobacillus oceanisediminis TaxID=665099 RepID=A0A562JRY8_9BACI|nr:NAD(P)/FAD-dependent oxidoreductase [Cytobacillus oceanisediminis]TWH85773.1 cation diffusion facilitator CzcD-associated flavoprotein CzcO [Cytobacillus oceanisediminis]
MSSNQKSNSLTDLDAVIVGAGFSGLYMLYRLREAGFSTRVFEAGDNVGGTWYWNRYPGARCDVESIYYNYTFSEELLKEWNWSAKYAEQPEILSYINFVADKFDLRRDVQFNTRVLSARFDEKKNRWNVQLNNGKTVSAQYFITAVGCLSASNVPKFKGLETFKGEWYHTGHWPHEKVEFKGKCVGIIGTGSSGIQAIPVIAKEAEHLTVFQRTPQYSSPARNVPNDPDYLEGIRKNYIEIKEKMRHSITGIPETPRNISVFDDSPNERQRVFEEAWKKGGLLSLSYTYNDLSITPEANEIVAEFIRSKIRETIKKPEVAEKLLPRFYYGTKRTIIDTDYFETYNRDNVSLVDVKKAPIQEITASGVRTADAEYKLDMIVFATGFDAMTGPLFKMDIRGKDGVSLKEKWGAGEQTRTYLGLGTAGFPNMFMLTGPESPSVLSNMMVSIEQHVEWVSDCINYMRDHKQEVIEVKDEAENTWSKHCREIADQTLFTKTDSWYMGANIEGKARGFQIYLGGVGTYRKICDEVAGKGYEGFTLTASEESVVN